MQPDFVITARHRVLVVEDDRAIAQLVHLILCQAGLDVVVTEDPRRALATLRHPEARFELLLTDIIMPGMSGWTLAAEARKHRPRLPVVFMSASFPSALSTMTTDLDHLIAKPFLPADLKNIVRRALVLAYV